MNFGAISAADWAQVASAVFAALAAGAACLSVFRVERDRRTRVVPDLQIEVLIDLDRREVRLHVANYGGPAREVNVFGALGDFSFMGIVPPTSFWQSGESRTVVLAMPPTNAENVHAFVEGRDLGKRYVTVGTVGGASYRWPLRRAKKLSAAAEWQRLFPGVPGPLDVPHPLVKMETVERQR